MLSRLQTSLAFLNLMVLLILGGSPKFMKVLVMQFSPSYHHFPFFWFKFFLCSLFSYFLFLVKTPLLLSKEESVAGYE
jgi:hypothetical protein